MDTFDKPMRDFRQMIKFFSALAASVIIPDNKVIYRIVNAIEKPVNPIGFID